MQNKPLESKKKILVIEDQSETAMILSELLKLHGYDSTWAQDALEGLEVIKKSRPDLVLLDIMMPKMTGSDLLLLLKSNSTMSNIPVLMISSLNSLNEVEKCCENGAAGYITKPFDNKRMLQKVQSILNRNN